MITAPRGTKDWLPGEVENWRLMEDKLVNVVCRYGFREIRTPIFEHTELFQRGVGESTDIVEKEMYTFIDRGNRSLTLRPEGTASVVRAYLQHNLGRGADPAKLYYLGPMFRYERPQGGRMRQFHQFGVEIFGVENPQADLEVILIARDVLTELGINGVELHINSIGCPECRPKYRARLQDYLRNRRNDLCPDCRRRLETNPLRVLDCKDCQDVAKSAPLLHEALCSDCREHMELLQEQLAGLNVAYVLNPRLVRGLDYYTRTTFEFLPSGAGSQGTVIGGGRYDKLVETLGGNPAPGVGFAAGLERLYALMPAKKQKTLDVYAVTAGGIPAGVLNPLIQQCRAAGISIDRDFSGRSVKAQMKSADRLGAAYAMIIGETEFQQRLATLRQMDNGEQQEVSFDRLTEFLREKKKKG